MYNFVFVDFKHFRRYQPTFITQSRSYVASCSSRSRRYRWCCFSPRRRRRCHLLLST